MISSADGIGVIVRRPWCTISAVYANPADRDAVQLAHWLVVNSHPKHTGILGDALVMSSTGNVTMVQTGSNCYKVGISDIAKLETSIERPRLLGCGPSKFNDYREVY